MIGANKKTALRYIIAVIVVVIITAAPFVTLFVIGVTLPSQYSLTYYGELAPMYSNLKNTEGKKIAVIGNSNVAFGVDSALAERLLREAGLDYSVCNFGLYGNLGTKMMLDLSYAAVNEGDIVIFTPEISEQSLSLWFSPQEAWYALDSDLSMYYAFPSSERGKLAAGFLGYASGKHRLYAAKTPAQPSAVYARDSFDEHCDLKAYDRPYNVMQGGVDSNNPIELDADLLTDEFANYVNKYYAKIKNKGAEMLFSYTPMNKSAVTADADGVQAFYDAVRDKFDFDIISDIENYIMDDGWFYDSNFHLNASGMTVRTVNLVNDVKNYLGNTKRTDIVLPEMPIKPDESITGEGDNSCASCFEYRQDGNYYTVTGLTQEGATRSRLVVPYQVNGLYVKAFEKSVFADNKRVEEIVIQKNIRAVYDNSFDGCDGLKKIYFEHTAPSDISVGYGMLNGVDAKIYLPQDALNAFKNNYFWGYYANSLYGY